jgi:site-specific recombinase XerD
MTSEKMTSLRLHGAGPDPIKFYLDTLAEGSRRTMREALALAVGIMGGNPEYPEAFRWTTISYQDTAKVRAYLMDHYAVATANKILAGLRGALRQAWKLGLLEADQYQHAADLPAIRGRTAGRGRRLEQWELAELFSVCGADDTPRGARDRAMLAVLYGAGIRRQEAAALTVGAYDRQERSLLVEGKGRRQRRIPLPPGSCTALDAWLETRGAGPGPLFVTCDRAGRIRGGAISPEALNRMCERRAAQAGCRPFSPHDLRRSYVSDLLDRGADLSLAKRLAGHATTDVTSRYDRRGAGAERQAAALIDVPCPDFGGTTVERRQ